MKKPVFPRKVIAFSAAFLVFSCESRKPEKITAPQVFNPVEEEMDKTATVPADTLQELPQPVMPGTSGEKPERKPMPTVAELKEITPSQEAKRELSNDAMKAAHMGPAEFIAYMKTRIPYYRGKGNLKTENDMVRIQVYKKEMRIETVKGTQVFPME